MRISNEATKAAQEILESWRHISPDSELWISEIIQTHFNKVRKPLVDLLRKVQPSLKYEDRVMIDGALAKVKTPIQ